MRLCFHAAQFFPDNKTLGHSARRSRARGLLPPPARTHPRASVLLRYKVYTRALERNPGREIRESRWNPLQQALPWTPSALLIGSLSPIEVG